MDSDTTVEELKQLIKNFCTARDWDQYHNPKDLAIGVITEASELLEHFRFKNEEEIQFLLQSEKREEVSEEMADTLYFLLRLSQKYDIDISDALKRKMQLNELKSCAQVERVEQEV
jgi:NTP pyrophosphatase (non-canonical NTP hydrolase)